MANIRIEGDFFMIEALVELDFLKRQLVVLNELEATEIKRAQSLLKQNCNSAGSSWDDPDWLISQTNYDDYVEVTIPRMIRHPFIISAWAVYETIVIEIAELVKTNRNLKLGIDDIRGDFLSRAKKYYSTVLQLELSANNTHWEQLTTLYKLRNAFAHSNGRFDRLKGEHKKSQEQASEQYKGILKSKGALLVSNEYLCQTLDIVTKEANELITRAKQANDNKET